MILSLLTSFVLAAPPALSVRVDGDGYLRFVREGRIVYAKSADLVPVDGQLGASQGPTLIPAIAVPKGATHLNVDLEGHITADSPAGRMPLGRIVLAVFPAAATFAKDGTFLLASSRPSLASPGEGTFGVIRTPEKTQASATRVDHLKTAGPTSIVLHEVSEVEADEIYLRDIAEIKGSESAQKALGAIDLGRAPQFGIETRFDQQRLNARLKFAGYEPGNLDIQSPATVIVKRKAQLIKQADFIEAAKRGMKEKLGVDLPVVCNEQTPDFPAPFGDVQLVAENATRSGMSINVQIAVMVAGKRINSRTVTLTVDQTARGVAANAVVKVVVKSGGLTVELPGKTRTAGLVGQTVTVVTDTGSVMTGTVISDSKVEVKL